ncbi:methyltransferase domain-containing protein [Pseudanabaena sp. FACHB-2040]|uniref:class I SAM-dependent methyltransferase n=1 Tax=Pseudanabaena sp. FACHB-2040 TaxID=2692859 RepID=UPI001687DD92|nr:methyltransferase domain-containing protein [Pseudanabaena sp. FACHB-2040]MBD2257093.1 methyltransferase domain-containing protein [Pseudanabaena sp. FACHB-2040]
MENSPNQAWNTDLYQSSHSFVWQYGESLLDLLSPKSGERILDLGCGTGQLTNAIAKRGATTLGTDADADMIAQAQKNFPELQFEVADARYFVMPDAVDAVFSNAVLHWIQEQDWVAERIWQALKPGGRFVAEFGGKGCIQSILDAIHIVRSNLGYGQTTAAPWYFPSVGEYATLLEQQGFEVSLATLFDRPTPLEGETGLANWIFMFAGRFLGDLTMDQQAAVIKAAEDWLRPSMYQNGRWIADYRRLRVVAIKHQTI